MTGKSRRDRRRHSARSKERKGRRSPLTTVDQRQAVAPIYEAVAHPEVSTSSASVPIPKTTPAVVRYSYIGSELRRIGILAGIMLVILVVLARVLS